MYKTHYQRRISKYIICWCIFSRRYDRNLLRHPLWKDTPGANRFAPPQPRAALPLGTVVNATQVPAACPQLRLDLPPFVGKAGDTSEDCLSLTITRPRQTTDIPLNQLPVLVWVHGGGALYGSNDDHHTNSEKLMKLSLELDRPIIFVAINYRLGMFGFASSDTLKAQKSENVGMRDQRFAFQWLKQNITTFGGNPDKITAYGLSAGGILLSLQRLAYAGEKGVPFDQAYMMSGPTGTARNQTSNSSRVNTAAVAKRLVCPVEGQQMLDCLRQAPVDRLVTESYSYAQELHPPLGLFTFVPTVDDDFLPARASQLLREAKFVADVPTIMAWTEDDGAMNAGPPAAVVDESSFLTALQPWTSSALTESQINQLLEVYPEAAFQDQASWYNSRKPATAAAISPHWYRLSAFVQDLLFTCSSIEFTYQVFKHNRRSGASTNFDKLRMYQLNQSMLNPLWEASGMGYVGLARGSDTNYISNGLFPEGEVSETDAALSRLFAGSILEFAHTGNPVFEIHPNQTFAQWPVAYQASVVDGDEAGSIPSAMNLLVIGGAHGTRSVHLAQQQGSAGGNQPFTSDQTFYNRAAQGFNGIQQAILGSFGRMQQPQDQRAKEALDRQDVFRRCSFINSLADVLGQ